MIRVIILLLTIVYSSLIQAQEIVWQNTIGGDNVDILEFVEQTNDEGYILGGYSWSSISGDKNENTNGLSDYWIVKLDDVGNIEWQNTIGGSKDDQLHCLRQTTDGGFILGGHSNSGISGDKAEDSIGFRDLWIIKADSAGNIQWQNTIGGSKEDLLVSIIQTFDGGFIICGSSSSDISTDKSENSYGLSDFWIVKLDSIGNIEWQKTIGGSDYDNCSSILQTNDSGYVLAGDSRSGISGNKTVINNGGVDYWILKINSIGNIQWQKSIGGSADDVLISMSVAPDNGLLLTGFSGSGISGDKTENSFGLYDIWVVKTDSTGDIQWQNTIGGSNYDVPANAYATIHGNYILGGITQSDISGNKKEKQVGGRDYWIMKLDSSGQILWQNTIGGLYDDFVGYICQTNDGDHIMAGFSDSFVSGDKTEPRFGTSDDYWVVKVSGKSNSITGSLFADHNGNNIEDSLDAVLPNHKLTELNTNRIAFTENNGNFNIFVNDTGYYPITPTPINHYTASPILQSAQFNSFYQIDSLNDFAFQPNGIINDLCINISPITPFRSGFNASYLIDYSNRGTSIQNPTVVFYIDTGVTFVSSTILPTLSTPDSLVFSIGTLNPLQTGQIQVNVYIHQNLPIGSLINSGTAILPVVGDANPICNQSWWEVYTTGSYDPNDILVNRSSLFTNEFPSPPFLEYVIRFQNTGNDTAFNINIMNPIDTLKLDISTLEFAASSHPANMQFIYYQKNIEFNFNNILLVDSNTNEQLSHGFVRYRIKPKSTLVLGNYIWNYAAIYFDYNEPIFTNTALTQIITPTSLNEIAPDIVQIFPNPTTGQLIISISNWKSNDLKIELYNIYGEKIKLMYENKVMTNYLNQTFDVSFLNNGVYFLRMGNHTSRFVKL